MTAGELLQLLAAGAFAATIIVVLIWARRRR